MCGFATALSKIKPKKRAENIIESHKNNTLVSLVNSLSCWSGL